MNVVNSDCKTTLLLNGAWQPLATITAKDAFLHLLKDNVTALDKNSNLFHSLESWNRFAEFYEDQPVLRSSKAVWPIPTLLVVTSKYFAKPKRKKLSLYEMAKIHGYTCQYCFGKKNINDLTIDHIQPRSKGGTDDHSNRVLACRSCNCKKGSFTPWYDINGNVPQAPPIPSFIYNINKVRKEWESFL
jgi:5-methylcytosine-specific restriction endonuclease McrA